jgi:hypothetical protein
MRDFEFKCFKINFEMRAVQCYSKQTIEMKKDYKLQPLSAGHRALTSASRVLELDHREEGKNFGRETSTFQDKAKQLTINSYSL